MTTHKSEVARFREQQALRDQSAQWGLSGVAIVANHASINARMEKGAERLLHLLKEGKQHEVIALMERPDWGADVEEKMMVEQENVEG